MKTIAVIQSNYLPWRGYFDIMHDADEFIFYDEAQYTKNDWRNRNRVYSVQGLSWITLPCGYDLHRSILETRINSNIPWQRRHWNAIENAYRSAPYFDSYKGFLLHAYFERRWEYLHELNRHLILHIAKSILGISAVFSDSRRYHSAGTKTEKLVSLLKSAGCKEYISGPSASAYLSGDDLKDAGMRLTWKNYSGYPEYRQQRLPFEGSVSILDLLFNVGPDAPYYIWGWRQQEPV